MEKTIKWLPLMLQLFSEGASEGGDNGASADSSFATKGNSQPNENVNDADLDAEFKSLVKGKYKSQYQSMLKSTIAERFKNQEDLQSKLDATTPILETLQKKYGVANADPNAILQALEDDDSYYEEEALEKGVSVEHLKEMKKLQAQVDRQNKQINAFTEQKRRAEQYSKWVNEANALKQKYPSFDVESELQDPTTGADFGRLLQSGVDMETAFTVIHKDELIPAAMQKAASVTSKAIVDDIMANGQRPLENGANGGGAVVQKLDPSKLTDKQLAEIRKTVAQGGRVVF